MQKQLLISLLIFCSKAMDAQYHPMLMQDHVWKCTNYGLIVNSYEFSMGPDSVENSVVYKTIWLTQENQEPLVYALLIEDTYTQKVFIKQGDEQILLYDFSLEVGDDATVIGVGGFHDVQITEVGTAMVGGTNRKKISFMEEFGPAGYWIEGVGSNFGPTDAALGMVLDFYPQVTCFYEDGSLAWDNPDITDSECGLQLSSPEIEDFEMNWYPNPSSDIIRMAPSSYFTTSNLITSIYAITGECIREMRFTPKEIDISDLSPGIYLILSREDGRIIGTSRLTKMGN